MIQLIQCIIIVIRAIDKIVPHNDEKVILIFGTDSKKNSCDASFGVDDVMIYTK